jgi:integrase
MRDVRQLALEVRVPISEDGDVAGRAYRSGSRYATVSGHVFLRDGKRGASWYAKYRIGERQQKKRLGPAWRERGRPPEGCFTRRTAEAALQEILTDARRGAQTLAPRSIGVTFADASAEWLRYCTHERAAKRSTLIDYRAIVRVLDGELADVPLVEVSTELLERWLAGRPVELSNRTRAKYVTALNSIFKRAQRVWKLPTNPAAGLERPRFRNAKSIEVYTPEEVWALARAASEQDAATFLVAAFCGLRMGEVLALTWRDADFARRLIRVRASYTQHRVDTPKSSGMRAVPMADAVARVLDRLSQREHFTADGDLVFPNQVGDHQNPKQLRKRYRTAQDAAGLRPLTFHDLRHTFGTLAINRADPVSVQHWMGHANLQTTMRYLHFRQRDDEADLLSEAFEENRVPNLVPKSADLGLSEDNSERKDLRNQPQSN